MKIEVALSKVRPPRVPIQLRQRTLQAAKAAMQNRPNTLIDFLFENWMVRIAWICSVVGLALFLIYWNPSVPQPIANPVSQRLAEQDDLNLDQFQAKVVLERERAFSVREQHFLEQTLQKVL